MDITYIRNMVLKSNDNQDATNHDSDFEELNPFSTKIKERLI